MATKTQRYSHGRGSIIRACEHCGTEFSVWLSTVAAGKGRCCSKACANKRRLGKPCPKSKERCDKKPRRSYECQWCGKACVEDRPRPTPMRYCSNKCSATAVGMRKRSGRSAGRRSLESRVWAREIIKRDLMCVDCGATEKLQAHHIKGWNEAPELRYELSNGETLCFRCHHSRHPHLSLSLFEHRSQRRVISCEQCGKKCVAKKPTRKYCSQECAVQATILKPLRIFPCETCGETIATRLVEKRFCCAACKHVDSSKRMHGDDGNRMRSTWMNKTQDQRRRVKR